MKKFEIEDLPIVGDLMNVMAVIGYANTVSPTEDDHYFRIFYERLAGQDLDKKRISKVLGMYREILDGVRNM